MQARLRLIFALLALGALLVLATSGCAPTKTTGAPPVPSGAPTDDMAPPPQTESSASEGFSGNPQGVVAPNVTGTTLDGQPFDLSTYKGKVVVVDFWATWCPPCRKGIPDLIALQTKYGSQGLQIVGFSVDREESEVKSFVTEQGINYPILIVGQKVSKDWGGVNSIPATFILDKAGVIQKDFVGLTPIEELESAIKGLL
jgi:thiol-disulfide isomerase/thioredoxin